MTSDISEISKILKKAVQLDGEKKYQDALDCYKEGIQLLIDQLKNCSKSDETKLRAKIEEYMKRAEYLKNSLLNSNSYNGVSNSSSTDLENEKSKSSSITASSNELASSVSIPSHTQIIIEENSTGHSYERLFGAYLNDEVSQIEIEDPYIRIFHQCQNLLRFLELVVRSCQNLKHVKLITIRDKSEQQAWLNNMKEDLNERFRIQMIIEYNAQLHDREIRFNNGWVIKIGRGLDYFKPEKNKFALGSLDMDLRKCHLTTVDIFHRKTMNKSYG